MYKIYPNNNLRHLHKWKENVDHHIMGNGELIEFFEKRTDFSNYEEQLLKQMFDAATKEEKEVLSSLLKRMVKKDRH